ncbi:HlyD family secretion protein [Lignipirellula cremea]|uniref:HlyD family secretion protein n=1 Tax=Lignipirellula cremea TaxID=2528010 RepID=A0A518DUM9_9BACT|nr:HlyD family efflux transporter periplasmic adaptor subunit [Lignipirellula cremea]QDU95545.1 HlyD family secretion protein [Lignipirellula cremea]
MTFNDDPASTAVASQGLDEGDRLPPRMGEQKRNHADIDPQLIQETRQQIRKLVHEVTQLSQSDCTAEEFYDGFLNRVVSALASAGGAVWVRTPQGGLDLAFQINLNKTGLPDDPEKQLRHALLLKRVLASGEATLSAPQSGGGPQEAGNPTDFLLVVGGIKINGQCEAMVEIFQRPGGGPATHRGYLRFLLQMCDLAADFLKNRQLKNFDDRQNLWEQLDDFVRRVYACLDLQETIFTIANEGRRLIGCDRVSVALPRGSKCRIEAVSGLDSFDRRADEIKLLSRLASTAVKTGQPLWYRGDSSDLPPQIEQDLDRYLDKSHTRMLAVLPLYRPQTEEQTTARETPELMGALIVEQFVDKETDAEAPAASQPVESPTRRIEVVAEHGAAALTNAFDHSTLFLLPVWRKLGKATSALRGRKLLACLLVAGLVATVVGGLFLAPYEFSLSSTGALRPQTRREVFAGIDGKLIDVAVDEGDWVDANSVVARMRNPELEVEVTRLLGRRRTLNEQIDTAQRALLEGRLLSPAEQSRLEGELAQFQKTAENIERQLVLYREKQQHLVVRSPARGQVVTWRVRENLLHRPVQRGQSLMTIVDPESSWELELHAPEKRLGHIQLAYRNAQKAGETLPVDFVLATHPGEKFEGQITAIDGAAEVHGDDGNTVLIRVAIDAQQLPQLRDGAKVTAKVHCGQRPLGYVLFHDFIETVQSRVLFWF